MLKAEWPLIIFTLLGQAAAGLFLGVAIVRQFLSVKLGAPEAAKLTKRALLFTGVTLVLALVFAFFHLGSPLGAFRALNGVGTSWLSREILFTVVFGALWLVSFMLDSKGPVALPLVWVTALAGLVMVYVMSMVYTSTIIPAWTTAFTVLTFLATALVLGGLCLLAFLPAGAAESIGSIALMALLGIGLQLVGLPVYMAGLGTGPAVARMSLTEMTGPMAPYLWAHLLCVAVAGGLLGVIWQRRTLSLKWVYAALVFGLVGEIAARVLFYATAYPIHVG